MKKPHAIFSLSLLVLFTVFAGNLACGPGVCPTYEDETEEYTVSSASYELQSYESATAHPLDDVTDLQLEVDRESGTTVLSFVDADGQPVTVTLSEESSQSQPAYDL